MTGTDFASWVAAMAAERSWSKRRCARELHCGNHQIRIWAATGAPHYIGLACAAIDIGLQPWPYLRGGTSEKGT